MRLGHNMTDIGEAKWLEINKSIKYAVWYEGKEYTDFLESKEDADEQAEYLRSIDCKRVKIQFLPH